MVVNDAFVHDDGKLDAQGDAAFVPQATRKPLLLVLVGIPGSGKSTLAARLREKGWAVVSQDTLGDRRSCELATARHLREGRNTVIDRCNFDVRQRATWLQVASAVCGGPGSFVPVTLRLATEFAVCRRRMLSRTDHPTLNASPESAAIIDRFQQDFVGPKAAEGFAARFVARSSQDLEVLLPLLLAAAAEGGVLPLTVPSDLLDSDADSCYGRGGRSASRPAGQQRGRGRQPWQQLQQGRAPQAYSTQGRSWQPAARPRPPAGQLWRPLGAALQQQSMHPQQWATPQQQQQMRPVHSGSTTGAALSGVWHAPASATQGQMPEDAGEQQPDVDRIPAEQPSHQPGAPSTPSMEKYGVQSAEQRLAALQISSAAFGGRQSSAPPPYRPPGW